MTGLLLVQGAMGFHWLRVWPILAIRFRDLHFNCSGFEMFHRLRV